MDEDKNPSNLPPAGNAGVAGVPSESAIGSRQALFTPQPDPVASNTATNPAQSSVNLSHPYFSNHPTQTFNNDTGDIILNTGTPKPKQNKRPFIIGGIILAVFTVICVVILIIMSMIDDDKSTDFDTSIGKINTEIIFDETAPIPVNMDNNYGYISPKDGSQIIRARFLEAERFYGEYAVTKLGSEGHTSETLVINRSGETVFTFIGDNTSTYYDVENNFWMVDGDIYNVKMQKISPEGTISKYIGNGYILVTEKVDDFESQEAAADDDSSTNGGSDEQDIFYGRSYIADTKNNKVYDCQEFCSAFTVKIDDSMYAITRVWNGPSRIINLTNGQIIYTTSQGKIYWDESGLVEETGDDIEYLRLKNGQIEKNIQPENTPVETISDMGEYVIETCDGSKYIVKALDGSSITKCDIEDYYELPTSLYAAYRNNYAESPILIIRDRELQLFDMSKSQVIRLYDGQDVSLYDNSPFLFVQNQNDDVSYICNLLYKDRKNNNSCIKNVDENSTVDGFGNYFTLKNEDSNYIYNFSLKEISK